MKTNHRTHLVTAAFSLAFLSTGGCTEKGKPPEVVSLAAPNTATATITPNAPGPTAPPETASPASSADAVILWSDIKDDTYDKRVHFLDGLKQLEAKVDGQIAELTAKRATLKGTTSTEDWDFAMKEMESSRAYLVSMGEELSKATPDTWDQKKDKVSQAWVKTQEAYGKVKASTTS